MKMMHIKRNEHFIAREFELSRLAGIQQLETSSLIVVYGRRRVGKTELLEQAFRHRHILKFEGIEGKSETAQMALVMEQLAHYTGEPLLQKLSVHSWREVFQIIAKYIAKGEWTLYFEEIQWLADYKTDFIAELKYVWDNYFRHNPKLILILCGSSPSFIIKQVLHSKSLYNRSQFDFPLNEFNLIETQKFLAKKARVEVLSAYLMVGGIPEYLRRLTRESSVLLAMCKNSFTQGSFFAHEYEKIFTSSLSNNPSYKKIIEYLAKNQFAARNQIVNYLKLKSGGSLTSLLTDLEVCGFITRYAPYNLNSTSMLTRYAISDNYLQFYFKFIRPVAHDIENGTFNKRPLEALNLDNLQKWLGFAFERFCRKNHRMIANALGFGAVQYRSGAYFSRQTDNIPGYQLDLVFERKDQVYTVCEIKYSSNPIRVNVIAEFDRKLESFQRKKNYTLQKVLITSAGVEQSVINKHYFDRIITLDDLFDEKNLV